MSQQHSNPNEGIKFVLQWLKNHKPEYLENKTGRAKTKVYECIMQWVIDYINKVTKANIFVDEEFDMNNILSWVKSFMYVRDFMEIEFIDNDDRDDRIYMIQLLLIAKGYNCDLNGNYTKYTRESVVQFKKDNNITSSKGPIVNWEVWLELLSI
jgi:hypothetical protein